MILHIFKKDFRILWVCVLGVALIDLAAAMLQTVLEGIQLRADAQVLSLFLWAAYLIALLFGFVVIAMVVQLDPIPGARQDWLARPIARRDVLLAKLLFVVAFIQLPLLVADTLHGLVSGFALGQTLAAAGARNLYLFVLMTLPVMALATLTNSVKQTLNLGLAVALGALGIAGCVLMLYDWAKIIPDNGHTMTSFVLQMAVLLAGASAIIALQYFRRATGTARLILVLAAILAMAAHFLLPQDAAYAIEEGFSSGPGQDLSLAFAPQAGRIPAVPGATPAAGSENRTIRNTLVALPFAVTGLPPQLMPVGESVGVTLTAPDGDSVALQVQGVPLQTSGRPAGTYYQVLRVPGDFFDAHQGQPVRAEFNYELALHRPQVTYEIAAEGGELHIPRLGRCAAIIGPFGTDVLLHCMQAGEEHLRVDVALVDDAKNLSNLTRHVYSPSDAPFRNGDDMITRFNATLFFRDDRTNNPYPVGAAQIPEAKVRFSVSEPVTWIHRHVTISGLRLEAWTARDEGASP